MTRQSFEIQTLTDIFVITPSCTKTLEFETLNYIKKSHISSNKCEKYVWGYSPCTARVIFSGDQEMSNRHVNDRCMTVLSNKLTDSEINMFIYISDFRSILDTSLYLYAVLMWLGYFQFTHFQFTVIMRDTVCEVHRKKKEFNKSYELTVN